MLYMSVLTLTGPLRSIDLVLLSILFSINIPPKHHTNKDHFIRSISSKYPCRDGIGDGSHTGQFWDLSDHTRTGGEGT